MALITISKMVKQQLLRVGTETGEITDEDVKNIMQSLGHKKEN